MRHGYLQIFGILLVFTLVFTACKKERGPRLIVHVQENDGTPAIGASVHAWYGPDAGVGTKSTLNDILMDQTTSSDGSGDATFDFKFSAVLDVDVIYYKSSLDSLLNPVIDTLYGHRVVKIEAVRQRSSENNYRETVVIQ